MVRKVSDPIPLFARVCAALIFCASLTAQAQTTISVSSAAQLQSALQTANSAGGNRIISLADGTYTLSDTLYVNAPNVSIVGASGNREAVIIQGTGMSASASVGTIIRVAASGFTLRYVTVQKSKYHLVQIVGENNADSPTLRDCILRDAYEQMVKVSVNQSNTSVSSDNGLVENCLFEYTAGIGPQYYIGGIDARQYVPQHCQPEQFGGRIRRAFLGRLGRQHGRAQCDHQLRPRHRLRTADLPEQRRRDPQQHDLPRGKQSSVRRQRHRARRES
jgi:hypothetical protein